jgi:tRNA A37 N6-isopentenylltransferase MiaA
MSDITACAIVLRQHIDARFTAIVESGLIDEVGYFRKNMS